jgi:hypothetical protein
MPASVAAIGGGRMQSVVMVPLGTAPSKIIQARAYGRRWWLSMGISITRSLNFNDGD